MINVAVSAPAIHPSPAVSGSWHERLWGYLLAMTLDRIAAAEYMRTACERLVAGREPTEQELRTVAYGALGDRDYGPTGDEDDKGYLIAALERVDASIALALDDAADAFGMDWSNPLRVTCRQLGFGPISGPNPTWPRRRLARTRVARRLRDAGVTLPVINAWATLATTSARSRALIAGYAFLGVVPTSAPERERLTTAMGAWWSASTHADRPGARYSPSEGSALIARLMNDMPAPPSALNPPANHALPHRTVRRSRGHTRQRARRQAAVVLPLLLGVLAAWPLQTLLLRVPVVSSLPVATLWGAWLIATLLAACGMLLELRGLGGARRLFSPLPLPLADPALMHAPVPACHPLPPAPAGGPPAPSGGVVPEFLPPAPQIPSVSPEALLTRRRRPAGWVEVR